MTEVLASHGNNQLGGDDFDELLVKRLAEEFRTEHGVDLVSEHGAAYSRLFWAVEEAKKTLSFEPYAKLREESLVSRKGKTLHLERETLPRRVRGADSSARGLDSSECIHGPGRRGQGPFRHRCGFARRRLDAHTSRCEHARGASRHYTQPGSPSGFMRGAGRRHACVPIGGAGSGAGSGGRLPLLLRSFLHGAERGRFLHSLLPPRHSPQHAAARHANRQILHSVPESGIRGGRDLSGGGLGCAQRIFWWASSPSRV